MAKKYLDPDQMTLVIVGDEKTVKAQVDGGTSR
jgi:predicted Zn-dependent peptidase